MQRNKVILKKLMILQIIYQSFAIILEQDCIPHANQ